MNSRIRIIGGRKYVRKGDYLVPLEDYEAAEQSFHRRSRGSRARDKLSRAPISRSEKFWETHQKGYDYPAVDTPTDEPRRAILDDWVASRDWTEQSRGGIILDPGPEKEWHGSTLLGAVEESSEWPDDTLENAYDAFKL